MYNVNSKLQFYQEKKSGDISQRLKKKMGLSMWISVEGDKNICPGSM